MKYSKTMQVLFCFLKESEKKKKGTKKKKYTKADKLLQKKSRGYNESMIALHFVVIRIISSSH